MKKILTLGTTILTVVPITTVIACGDSQSDENKLIDINTEETAYDNAKAKELTLDKIKAELEKTGSSLGIQYWAVNLHPHKKTFSFLHTDTDTVLTSKLNDLIDYTLSGDVPESLSTKNKWAGWTMVSNDVVWHTVNTTKHGIIQNIDVHTSSRDTALTSDFVLTIPLSKVDIVNSLDDDDIEYTFDTVATKLKNFLDENSTKNYGMLVEEIEPDTTAGISGEEPTGEWEIKVFEKIQSDAKMDAAIKSLKEDFHFNEDAVKTVHGTYLYGNTHEFNALLDKKKEDGTDITISNATTNDDYHGSSFLNPDAGPLKEGWPDRRDDETLATWTNYVLKEDKFADESERERIFKIFNDPDNNHGIILRQVQFVRDFKTGVQNLRIVVERTDTNVMGDYTPTWGTFRNTETIYIPAPIMNDWYEGDVDEARFKYIVKKRINFITLFDFLDPIKDQASVLDTMQNIKDLIIHVSSNSPKFAASSHFMGDDEFLDDFYNYLSLKYTSSQMKSIYSGLEDYEYLHQNDWLNPGGIINYGGYAYNGLSNLEIIMTELDLFIDVQIGEGNYELVEHSDFRKLRDDLREAEQYLDAREFLKLYNVDASHITDDKLFEYIKTDVLEKGLIYAPSDDFKAKIETFKSIFESAGTDITQVTWTKSNGDEETYDSFTEQTKLLIEFLGENFGEFKDETITTEEKLVSKLRGLGNIAGKTKEATTFEELVDVKLVSNTKYYYYDDSSSDWTDWKDVLIDGTDTPEKIFEIFFEEFDLPYLIGESKFQSFSYKIYYGLLKPLGITVENWG